MITKKTNWRVQRHFINIKHERYLQKLCLLAKCQDTSKFSKLMLQSHLQPWQPEFCLENEIVWVFRKTWPVVYSYDWGNRQRPLKHWHNLNWLNLPSFQMKEYYWGSQHAITQSLKTKSTLLYFCYGNSTKERKEMRINMKCSFFISSIKASGLPWKTWSVRVVLM